MPYRSLWPQRRLEWWLACFTLGWGFFLLLTEQAFDGRIYAVVRLWASQPVWGGFACTIGMFHVWALYINGRRHWSAHVRAAATAANTAIFTVVLAGMIASVWYGMAPAAISLVVYTALVGAGVCAFVVAARDSCEAGRRQNRAC